MHVQLLLSALELYAVLLRKTYILFLVTVRICYFKSKVLENSGSALELEN